MEKKLKKRISHLASRHIISMPISKAAINLITCLSNGEHCRTRNDVKQLFLDYMGYWIPSDLSLNPYNKKSISEVAKIASKKNDGDLLFLAELATEVYFLSPARHLVHPASCYLPYCELCHRVKQPKSRYCPIHAGKNKRRGREKRMWILILKTNPYRYRLHNYHAEITALRTKLWADEYKKMFPFHLIKPKVSNAFTVLKFCRDNLPLTYRTLVEADCLPDLPWPEFSRQCLGILDEWDEELLQTVTSSPVDHIPHGNFISWSNINDYLGLQIYGSLIRHEIAYNIFPPRKKKIPPIAYQLRKENPNLSWRKLALLLLDKHGVKVSSTALHKAMSGLSPVTHQ